MLRNYLKIAARHLLRNKVSTLIHLLGLTIGLSAGVIIYMIAGFELSYDRFHPDGDRIYRLVGTLDGNPVGFVPYALPRAVREEVSGLESLAAFLNVETEVKIPQSGDQPARTFASRDQTTHSAEQILVEPQYFDLFRYKWLAGNPQTALDEPYELVLTERKARRYFGDLAPDQVLGRTVIYMDSLPMRVTGIVQDWEQPSDLTFTDFLSFSTISGSFLQQHYDLNEWDDLWSASQAFVKLAEGTTPEQVMAQFPAFNRVHFPETFSFKLHLQPLSDLHFNAAYGDNYSRKAHLPTLYGLILIAGLILLMAAVNFINLATAQSFQRAREVGIRKTLGSGRTSLIWQFLGETFLLVSLAVVLSLIVIPGLLSIFQELIPSGVRLVPDVRTLLFLAGFAVGTTLLAGLYPALALSSYLPVLTLQGTAPGPAEKKSRLRKALIVFQFTLSLIFLLGTVLVSRQLHFMRHKDLGFASEAVLTLQLPRGHRDKTPIVFAQIQQLAGVQDATRQIFEPMGMNFGMDRVIYRNPNGEEQTIDAAYKTGDANFIPFYNMKLLAGRNVMESDSAKELVISESLVYTLGLLEPADAIDLELTWRDQALPVVGVVADFHQQSLHEKMVPTFITTTPSINNIAIKVKAEQFQATLAQLTRIWERVYPDKELEYSFLDDTIARFYEKEQRTARLINLATFIALLISCLGLYGLSAFTAARRAKEISIRKVLGASVTGVVALLSQDYVKLILLSAVLAFPVAFYFMQRWLAGFAYHVEIEWWMFAMSAVVALLVTLLTVSFQSLRVALAHPVEALKQE